MAGFSARLAYEGEDSCRVYRAAPAKWEIAECSVHEGNVFPLTAVIGGHRARYWPAPGNPDAFSIPAVPGCHHTIQRIIPEQASD